MRGLTLVAVGVLLLAPGVSAATVQSREATFPMAAGFDDRMTILSGAVSIDAPAVSGSSAFFRTTGAEIRGFSMLCWQPAPGVARQCADGADGGHVVVASPGASFGFSSPTPYSVGVDASHALATFVDLSRASGFDNSLHVGPSAILSMVGGQIALSGGPARTAASPGGLTPLEDSVLQVRTSGGVLLHTVLATDPPLTFEGTAVFPAAFVAEVAVVPFADGAQAAFTSARDEDASSGLADGRLDLLDEVLRNVDLIGPDAKAAPFAILGKAGSIVSEVFNGAFIRTSLAEDPNGLGDVALAKFEDLTVTGGGTGRVLEFDGSYTLVVGDLGPSFAGSSVSEESAPLRWWVGIFLLIAVGIVGAWLWLREGPVAKAEPGPQTWVARIATSIGVVVAFVVWDWQLNGILGSSLLTTWGEGAALGVLILVEVASLLLAGLLIGVPVFLAVRYGLALAGKPRYASLASTAAVFFTVAFGVLLMPALVSFLMGLAG